MKISTTKLYDELQKVAKSVEKREEEFENKSEKWQESEKGQMYQERTFDLEQIECDLETLLLKLWKNGMKKTKTLQMTKEQIIQEAYGEYWEKVKCFIDKNGWLDSKSFYGEATHKGLPGLTMEISDPYDPKYCYWKRPISLSGIENNNGWTKIESMDSFPQETIFCITCTYLEGTAYKVGTSRNRTPDDLLRMWQNAELTHFKQIEFNPPIF